MNQGLSGMNADTCIERFVERKACKGALGSGGGYFGTGESYRGHRVRSDGTNLHFYDQPIARFLSDNSLIIDCRRFSMTTDKYQQTLVSAARARGIPTQCGFRGSAGDRRGYYGGDYYYYSGRSFRGYPRYLNDPVDERDWDIQEIWRHVEWTTPPDIAALEVKAAALRAERTVQWRSEPSYGTTGWEKGAAKRDKLYERINKIEEEITRRRKKHPVLKELTAWAHVAKQMVREERWEERKAATEERRIARRKKKIYAGQKFLP